MTRARHTHALRNGTGVPAAPNGRVARHLISWSGRGLTHTLPSGVRVHITTRSEWVFELHANLCNVSRCRALLDSAGLNRRTLLRVFGPACTIELFERAGISPA